MRFYDPSTDPPERLDSLELFPRLDEAAGALKCYKSGLLPSVTTVLDTFREEYLERWFIKEGIRYFQEGKSPRDAVDAVYQDSENSMFGTNCHDIVESKLRGEAIPKDDPLAVKHSRPMLNWIDKNVAETIHAESLIASLSLKTAGTVDMVFLTKAGDLVVGDLKVVKFSDRFPPKPGLGYRCQLSAYAEMMREHTGKTFQRWSFYLASPFGWDKEPKLRIFRHTADYLPAFKAAHTIWETKLLMETLTGSPS